MAEIYAKKLWPGWDPSDKVNDEGTFWDPLMFWQKAISSTENKLTPSGLDENLTVVQDSQSARRLSHTFLAMDFGILYRTERKRRL